MLCLLLSLPACFAVASGHRGPQCCPLEKRKKKKAIRCNWRSHSNVTCRLAERFPCMCSHIQTCMMVDTHAHRARAWIHTQAAEHTDAHTRTHPLTTLLFGRGYWGGWFHTHTHTHTSSCPLTLHDPCWSTPLILSSAGVPVLLLWVPVEELRTLLLCDSGSCVSCHGLLLPVSVFLSESLFFLRWSLDLNLRWPHPHPSVGTAQRDWRIKRVKSWSSS